MSNLCAYCEHPPADHNMSFGRCSAESADPDSGTYPGVCPHFELDSQDGCERHQIDSSIRAHR